MVQRPTGEALRKEAKALQEVAQEVAALEGMGLSELRTLHLELYGEEPKSKNLPYLRKRLAWRMQERMEGGLSPRAQALIAELAPVELPVKARREGAASRATPKARVSPAPKAPAPPAAKARDPRLPAVGAVLMREHGGFAHEVEVLEAGFHYRGRSYGSLSAIAKEVTGTAWNGFLFFGLKAGGRHGQ